MSTEEPIPCQGPIDKYMIERSHVLDLLAERVIEGGLDALPPHHPKADVPTDAPHDDDVPMIEPQPIPASTASASSSAPEPSTSYAFYASVGDSQRHTSDRLTEMESLFHCLDNSFRFSSVDYRQVDLRLQRFEWDQITILDELKETRWELREIRNKHRETRAVIDTILARLSPPPPSSSS